MSNLKKLDSVSDNDVISFPEPPEPHESDNDTISLSGSTFKIKELRKLIANSIGESISTYFHFMGNRDDELGEILIRQITSNKMDLTNVINAEILQINEAWKPCKIRMRLELEVYTEEETDVNVDSSVDQADSVSLLDDIRQSIATNLQ